MEFTAVAIDMDPDGWHLNVVHEFALEFFQGDAQFGNRISIDITVKKHIPAGNLDEGGKFWFH
jgi:hypothetical protein